MSGWAKPGVKCVCINQYADMHAHLSPLIDTSMGMDGLREGAIYTITEIGIHPLGIPILWLKEITRPVDRSMRDAGFAIDRFRPVITTTQSEDVAAIRKLVDEMPITERLDRIGELL